MHVHKPHAPENLGALLKEVGVIVIGILIALGLEQAIEAWRAHREAEETDRALAAEVRANLAEAMQTVSSDSCMRAKIVELKDRLAAPGERWQGIQGAGGTGLSFGSPRALPSLMLPIRPGSVVNSLWNSQAVTRGLSHFDPARAHRYAAIYNYIFQIDRYTADLRARLDELDLLVFDQPLDAAARREYLGAVIALDHDLVRLYALTGFLIERARQNGITADTKDVADRLRFDRQISGACVQPYVVSEPVRAWAAKLARDEARGAAE